MPLCCELVKVLEVDYKDLPRIIVEELAHFFEGRQHDVPN